MPVVWAAVAGHHLGTQTPLKFLRYCAGEATAEVIGTMKVKDRACKTSESSETLVTFMLTFHQNHDRRDQITAGIVEDQARKGSPNNLRCAHY